MCIENKLSSQGIHYLRYLMSWIQVGCNFDSEPYWNVKEERSDKYTGRHGFEKWLRSTGLPEEEIKDILSMTGMGKLELESSIRNFLKELDS